MERSASIQDIRKLHRPAAPLPFSYLSSRRPLTLSCISATEDYPGPWTFCIRPRLRALIFIARTKA